MQNPHFSFCKTVLKILHFPLFQKRHRLRHNAKRNSARGFSKLSAPAKQKRDGVCHTTPQHRWGQKDSEPSLARRKRLPRRKFALQIRHGALCAHEVSQSFLPLPNRNGMACAIPFLFGRGRRTRTHDPWFWRPVLYQLSYTPVCIFLQRSILYHSFMQIASLFSKKDKVFFKKEIRLSRSRISSLNFYTYYHVSNTRLIFTLLDPPRAFSASGRDNCS